MLNRSVFVPMRLEQSQRSLLILLSICSVALMGLLVYVAIGVAIGCGEHDQSSRLCPPWLDDRNLLSEAVMFCTYFGPVIVPAAAIATILSRRLRYLVAALALTGTPLLVLAVWAYILD